MGASSQNAWPEPYVMTLNPADIINLLSALQTEGSSSTIQMVGYSLNMVYKISNCGNNCYLYDMTSENEDYENI